jgi:hypothetical protein
VLLPFSVNLYYNFQRKDDPVVTDQRPRPIDAGTPRVRRLSFGNIIANDAHYAAAHIYGLPEMPIEDVSFRDVAIRMSERASTGVPRNIDGQEPLNRAGFIARSVRGLRLDGVEVTGQQGEPFVLTDVK